MRFLVVEDDFVSRRILQNFVQTYGRCDIVVDGQEGIDAFRLAWEENDPYTAVFLDIMMPNVDGQQALKEIRGVEDEIGVRERDRVKVVMTTALEDPKNVVEAYYKGEADAYLVKPITRERIEETLGSLGILETE